MLQDFKNFILRGNVVELAVAVIIGAAFNGVVLSFVRDFLTPLIAMFGGKPDFNALQFTVRGTTFQYGDFINAIVSFLIIAVVVFVFVIEPMNRLKSTMDRNKTESPSTKKCPDCLSEIPLAAKRCPACTTWLEGERRGY